VHAKSLFIYEALVRVGIQLWEQRRDVQALSDAAEAAEASRSRALMDLLADEALAPVDTPPDLIDEFRRLRRELKQAARRMAEEEAAPRAATSNEATEGTTGDADETARGITSSRSAGLVSRLDRLSQSEQRLQLLRDEVTERQQLYAEALNRVRVHDPLFDPEQPVPPIDIDQMRSLLPTDVPTAIVQFTLLNDQGVAILITADRIDHIPLPELTGHEALQLAQEWFDQYYGPCRQEDGHVDFLSWHSAMERVLGELSRRCMLPVVARLETLGQEAGVDFGRLILVPHRTLHLFPLHACPLDGEDGETLLDRYEVAYAPSLSILHRCAQRPRQGSDRLLAIDVTANLLFVPVELARVERLHTDKRRVAGGVDVKQQVLEQSPLCRTWYYPGHAQFSPASPLDSALQFGNEHQSERWLRLRDVFCGLHLPETELAVLSSCESGMILPDQLDDYVGFPTGFLYAGARCVVSSLWVTDDLATMLLLDRFYTYHREERLPVGQALRKAQLWLRGRGPRQDPGLVNGAALARHLADQQFLASLATDGQRNLCKFKGLEQQSAHPNSPPYASHAYWAPFTAVGNSFK
jgi:CHAT domain-containing protein